MSKSKNAVVFEPFRSLPEILAHTTFFATPDPSPTSMSSPAPNPPAKIVPLLLVIVAWTSLAFVLPSLPWMWIWFALNP